MASLDETLRRSRFILVAVAFFLIGWRSDDVAAASGCLEARSQMVLMLAEGEKRAEFEPLSRAIASQLQDLPVCFEVEWLDRLPDDPAEMSALADSAAKDARAPIAFWLRGEPEEGYRLHLRLVFESRGTEHIREVVVSGRDGLAETLAIITRASILAVLASREEAPAPPARSPKSTPVAPLAEAADEETELPAPQDDNERPARFAISAAYFIGFPSRETSPTQGAAFGLRFAAFRHVDLFVLYLALRPVEESLGEIGLELTRHPTWLGGDIRIPVGHWEIIAGAALGIDYIQEGYFSSRSSRQRLEETESRVQISIIPTMGASLRVHRCLSFFATLCGEIVLNQYRYEIRTENEPKTVFNPWSIQPAFFIGMEVRPF